MDKQSVNFLPHENTFVELAKFREPAPISVT